MYLSQLILNRSRRATLWSARPYRVHQRLCMACGDDPRLLFRIEATTQGVAIQAQTHHQQDWGAAFDAFPVLAWSHASSRWTALREGQLLSFRLRANPTKRLCHGRDGKGARATTCACPLRRGRTARLAGAQGEAVGFARCASWWRAATPR